LERGTALEVLDPDRMETTDLIRAWRAPESLFVVPSKIPDPAWLARAVKTIPETFRVHHFALLTSGSTGLPKIVLGRKKSAESMALAIEETQGCQDARAAIVSLPLSYSFAFVNQFVWSVVRDRELVRTNGLKDVESLRTAWRSTNNSMVCLAGPQAQLVLGMMGSDQFPGVTSLNFAGGLFPQEHLESLEHMFPSARITNNYGCAEALPRLTSREARSSSVAANVGRPLPGIRLRSTRRASPFTAPTAP
jgi:acyl-CoA synthetase (AMP-forming)/AMP-acid ligase II